MNAPRMPRLEVGLTHVATMVVAEAHTVPRVADWPGFRDMPPVFATAMMVGFMEQTCIEALRPCLAPEQRTVGIHVDLSHSAATPVGRTVQARVELLAIDGRTLEFAVECRDEQGLIGTGRHRRAIIDLERFLARLASR